MLWGVALVMGRLQVRGALGPPAHALGKFPPLVCVNCTVWLEGC